MISRFFDDPRRLAAKRRADRASAVAIALCQAGVAAVGWFVEPIWLAVAIAAQLALGGLAAVYVIGPARHELGLARYAMPSVAGIAATLFGRLIPGGQSLLLVPIIAVLLWAITYLELRLARGTGGRSLHEVLLTMIVFTGASGLLVLFGAQAWPTPIILVAVLVAPVTMRSAEGRGALGVEAVGQAVLHLLAVSQVGLAVVLLNLSPTVLGALIALAFYTWGGAASALRSAGSGRSVAAEFGALVVLGLVVAMLLFRP